MDAPYAAQRVHTATAPDPFALHTPWADTPQGQQELRVTHQRMHIGSVLRGRAVGNGWPTIRCGRAPTQRRNQVVSVVQTRGVGEVQQRTDHSCVVRVLRAHVHASCMHAACRMHMLHPGPTNFFDPKHSKPPQSLIKSVFRQIFFVLSKIFENLRKLFCLSP